MSDDLSAPLGLTPSKSRWKRVPYGIIGFTLIAIMALGAVVWVAFFPDPMGGEPTTAVRIDRGRTGVAPTDVAVSESRKPVDKDANGKPVDPATDPASARAQMPDAAVETVKRIGLPAEGQPLVSTPVARLIDKGKYGPIPKIGPDGARPVDVYARPAPRKPASASRIVLVVGGLGLSQTGTQEALRLLPAEVTVAFAPYGNSLDRWMQRARQDGHEVLLQIPMEPFDYPDNDPGPQTLLTSLSADQNLDRLQWLMARLTNYVGVVNFMGAKFTASDQAMLPVLRDLAQRGLLYLDDGSSARSQADSLVKTAKVPFVRSDFVIDATMTEAAIDARLIQLENLARSKGLAVGTASALPLSVRKITEWAKQLESRGVVIVPASSIARDG